VGAQGGDSTFSGVIQNTVPGFANNPTVGLAKTGTGTFTLAGANTYTGATIIGNGTLLLTGSLANTPITVNSNLAISGSAGTTLAGTLTGTGNVIQNGPGNLTLSGNGITCSGNTIVNGGTLTLTATTAFNSAIQINVLRT